MAVIASLTLDKGLVVRDRFFYSWEQGLRAAGLEPEDWARPASRGVVDDR